MDDNTLDFLDHHSPEFIEMAYDYSRMEKITAPDAYGKRTGDCGDTIEMFLQISTDEIIEHVSISVDGCINTVATANTVAIMTEGKHIDIAWEVTPEKIFDYLKTLEEDHFHCAELAVGAFFLALTNYRQLKKKSWKKSYQDNKLSR